MLLGYILPQGIEFQDRILSFQNPQRISFLFILYSRHIHSLSRTVNGTVCKNFGIRPRLFLFLLSIINPSCISVTIITQCHKIITRCAYIEPTVPAGSNRTFHTSVRTGFIYLFQDIIISRMRISYDFCSSNRMSGKLIDSHPFPPSRIKRQVYQLIRSYIQLGICRTRRIPQGYLFHYINARSRQSALQYRIAIPVIDRFLQIKSTGRNLLSILLEQILLIQPVQGRCRKI